jgi:hypothetical protein
MQNQATPAVLTVPRTTDVERERPVARGSGIEQRPRLAGIVPDGLRVEDLDNVSVQLPANPETRWSRRSPVDDAERAVEKPVHGFTGLHV